MGFERVRPAAWEANLEGLACKGRLVPCGATVGLGVGFEVRPRSRNPQAILETKREPVIARPHPLREASAAQQRVRHRALLGKQVPIP